MRHTVNAARHFSFVRGPRPERTTGTAGIGRGASARGRGLKAANSKDSGEQERPGVTRADAGDQSLLELELPPEELPELSLEEAFESPAAEDGVFF
jgi:hypothetical protein